MPPTPQPSTPKPVDHRRVRIGADQRVGVSARRRRSSKTTRARNSRFTWWHDAGPRRHDLEVPERLLAPAEEARSARGCARTRTPRSDERGARAEDVDLDRVVDHELDRNQRVDLLRLAAQVGHGVAHRGEVDDGRDAGEVLEQDAGRRERDLAVRLVCRDPPGHGFDIRAVAGPKHVLEQDAQRVGEACHIPLLLQRVEPVDLELAIADRESGARGELVGGHASIQSNRRRQRPSGHQRRRRSGTV